MYAFKILSHKSFQLWDTAIIFNGVKGSYRKSMWKYVSTWWFNFTKKKPKKNLFYNPQRKNC